MGFKRANATGAGGPAASLIDAFDTKQRRRTLRAGDILARHGAEADEVFVVIEGHIVVSVDATVSPEAGTEPVAAQPGPLVLAELGPGDIAGEITVVAGGRRTADLTASGPATVLAIDRDSFETWLLDNTDHLQVLIDRARDRLDRTLVARILSELVSDGDERLHADQSRPPGEAERTGGGDDGIARLVERIEMVRLDAGEQLFAQGDHSDAAYIVVSGRLRVEREGPDARVLGEVGRSDVVGEMGLLDAAPRSASIRAVRDSTLARLSLEEFRALVLEKPQMILHFARTVLRRTAERQDKVDRATSVAVVVTTEDPGTFVDDLSTEIEARGSTMRLSAARVDEVLERPGISQSMAAASGLPRISEFLHEMEGRHDHLIYEIDSTDSYWGQLAIRQADRVVVVLSPDPDGAETSRLKAITERLETLSEVPVWYVIIESASARVPTPSAALRLRHRPDELMHVRRNRSDDAARVARLVIDQGIGLVLSGGGAKGIAHVGAVQAMNERGVPIDRIGGASIGAVVAAGFAMGRTHEELAETQPELFRGLLDYTIPLVSLLKGRRISNQILDYFDGWTVSDTWIPFFCVSSDLTAGELHLHDGGSLAEAIRASIAIPGMLPPIVKDGHLLVDGGVLDNLPVDTMQAQRGISRIVAVDVAPVEGPGAAVDYGPHVTATQVIRARFRRGPSPYPGLPSVLVRSMLVGAVRDRNRVKQSGAIDVYVDVDVPDVGLLEFDKGSRTIERGYRAAIEAIDRWRAVLASDGG